MDFFAATISGGLVEFLWSHQVHILSVTGLSTAMAKEEALQGRGQLGADVEAVAVDLPVSCRGEQRLVGAAAERFGEELHEGAIRETAALVHHAWLFFAATMEGDAEVIRFRVVGRAP
jgi:hypothetical protein